MKMHINRRNFLFGSLGATAITFTPLKVVANDRTTPAVNRYIQCGKINSTDLRHFYHVRKTADAALTIAE